MENQRDDPYYKGYIAGYLDGVRDGVSGKNATKVESKLLALPIEAMQLSTRAYHGLLRAKCEYIADVIALSENEIRRMRGIGTKTAREIACWLHDRGICYTHWTAYL